MKNRIQILLVLGIVLAHSTAIAQQNLFNVPSSDITLKARPFFQQQINLAKDFAQLNSTFSYGLGRNFEVGVNILGLVIDNDTNSFFDTNGDSNLNPVYPFFTFNCQKAWIMSNVFKLALGTQTGISKGGHFGSYDYGNLVTAIRKTRTKLITGVYYGTDSFIGPGKRNQLFNQQLIGFHAGFEQELFEGNFSLILENISGLHNLSETSFGLTYYMTPHWVCSLGYQIPNSKGINTTVIEFTYVPSAHVHRKMFRDGHHKTREIPIRFYFLIGILSPERLKYYWMHEIWL